MTTTIKKARRATILQQQEAMNKLMIDKVVKKLSLSFFNIHD